MDREKKKTSMVNKHERFKRGMKKKKKQGLALLCEEEKPVFTNLCWTKPIICLLNIVCGGSLGKSPHHFVLRSELTNIIKLSELHHFRAKWPFGLSL